MWADPRPEEEMVTGLAGPLRKVAEPGRELELIAGPFDGAQIASIFTLYDGSVLLVDGLSYVVQPDGLRAVYLSPGVLP